MNISHIKFLSAVTAYFFVAIATAGTFSGVYTGNFSGSSNQGAFSVMVDNNDVAVILAFDQSLDEGLAKTNVIVQSDGSFSFIDIDGTSVTGTVVAGSSVSGTFIDSDGASGNFSGSARSNSGLFASNGGYYRGASATIPAQCFGESDRTDIHAIFSADGSLFFYIRDQEGYEDGGVTMIASNGTFSGSTVEGTTFTGTLSGTTVSGSGIDFLTDADDGINGTCRYNFSASRVQVLPTQFGADSDGDGIGNNTDLDDDNDGIPDAWEIANGTNPLIADSNADIDDDGSTNMEEYLATVEVQRAFIERFYQNILNRTADQGGMDHWLNEIQSKSGAEVAFGFFLSTEFINLNLDNSNFVDILYKTLFNRDADQGGHDYWMGQLETGTLREMIVYGFVRSLEFQALADSFSVPAFSEEESTQFQIKSFVQRFYRLVLNREPDINGFNYWSSHLTAGTKAGGEIAEGFFNSTEFVNRNVSDSEFLDIAYRSFFDREADAGGKNSWLNKLSTGYSRQEVVHGFIDSQEFFNLANRFGIRAK